MKGVTVVKLRMRIIKTYPGLVKVEMPCSVDECRMSVSVYMTFCAGRAGWGILRHAEIWTCRC